MPYDPTAPTLTLLDDLVAKMRSAWGPNAPSEVRREYVFPFDLSNVTGRKVLFYPMSYDNAPATRGSDWYTHRIGVLTFERYTDAADSSVIVPKEWVDERVDFVYDQIVQGLEFGRDGVEPVTFASGPRSVVTLSADVSEVYDTERLEQNKAFWCPVEMVFQELRTA